MNPATNWFTGLSYSWRGGRHQPRGDHRHDDAGDLPDAPRAPAEELAVEQHRDGDRDLLDLVRSVARIGGGPAHVFYAPMIMDDAQTAAAMRRQGDIAGAFTLVPSVTIAVVAIGAWVPGLSTIYDAITPAERDALSALGVRAELAGVLIGEDGRLLATPIDSRMIVTPGPALERIPFVLSVAYGVSKSPAVWGFADHWRAVAESATRARRWCQRHQRDLRAAVR